MFKDASNCGIVATEYSPRYRRFSLTLRPQDGGLEFRVGFTDVAAYRFDNLCSDVIVTVSPTPLGVIVANDWQQFLVADQSGLWPGPLPRPHSVVAVASRLDLRGFTISLASGACAWAISKDFVLLGRRARA